MPEEIVIAVDFGTTFSAIGYCKFDTEAGSTNAPLYIIQDGWPGQGLEPSPKIPTLFKFENGEFKYGFDVQHDDDRIAFSKLFLDPYQVDFAVELGRCTNVKEVRQLDRLADSVSLYLKVLRERALEHMVKNAGWSETFINITPKTYVLTVPAIWSDNAREKTLDCAYRAGYGIRFSPESISLIREPEAAAAYTITTQPSQSFRAGDVFVVCDAGGGTVDLSAYKITNPMPRLELDEVAISDGDLCGSVFLDKEFLEHVEKKVGSRLPEDTRHGVLAQFREDIKLDFTGEDGEDHSVYVDEQIPNRPEIGLENGCLVVIHDEVKQIFDKIVGQILVLLTRLIDNVRKAGYQKPLSILLVGGFGSNHYLKQRITEEFRPFDVIQPPDAWSAIIRGSLMRGAIKKRKIRCAYGVVFRKKWTRDLDGKPQRFRDEHRVWGEYEDDWFCNKCMEWYVKNGEEFTDTKTVSFPYYRTVGLYHSMKFEDIVYIYMDGVDGAKGPEYKDGDCKPLAKVSTDLNQIEDFRGKLERSGYLKKSSSGWYYEIHFDLVMIFDNQIRFFPMYNGIRLDEAHIHYVEPEVRPRTRI